MVATDYRYGNGVNVNPQEAFNWFKKAGEQNYPKAQYEMGIYYIEGKVVRKNPIQAFKWFKRAANNGHLKSKKEMNKLTKK